MTDEYENDRRGPPDDSDASDGTRIRSADKMVVATYLDAVRTPKRRGRQRTLASAERDLEAVEAQLATDDGDVLAVLQHTQRRLELQREVEQRRALANTDSLENDFIEVAARYGESKGISYAAWREIGVEASVLKRAGITREH